MSDLPSADTATTPAATGTSRVACAQPPQDDVNLVLLHGFMGAPDDWDHVVDVLPSCWNVQALRLPIERIYEAVYPGDAPGEAPTQKPRMADGVGVLASWLEAALIDRFGALSDDGDWYGDGHSGDGHSGDGQSAAPRRPTAPHIVGYSLGGRVALAACLRAGFPASSLTLVGASPGLSARKARATRRDWDDANAQAIRDDLPAFLDCWHQLELFAPLASDPARVAARQARLAARFDSAERRDLLATAVVALSPGRMPPMWRALGELQPPLVYVAGALDTKYAKIGAQLAHDRDVATHLLEGAGHALLDEAPAGLARLLQAVVSQHQPEPGARPTTLRQAREEATYAPLDLAQLNAVETVRGEEMGDDTGESTSEDTSRHDVAYLFANRDIIAVSKPAGLLVHNSHYAGKKERSLRMIVGERVGHPVFPLHRIDRPTSGVVVFARDRSVVARWQEALDGPDTQKEYVAFVHGAPRFAIGLLDKPVKIEGRGRVEAQTDFVCHETLEDGSGLVIGRVHARLRTGRKHQLRQHLRYLHHPILGDTTWGRREINQPLRDRYGLHRLALHAGSLTFTAPTGERIELVAPMPADLTKIFDAFRAVRST